MPPTQRLSFISLQRYTRLSELKIASLTLCLMRITQPSHAYRGGRLLHLHGGCKETTPALFPYIMPGYSYSCPAIYDQRPLLVTCLRVSHPADFVPDINNSFESELVKNPCAAFCCCCCCCCCHHILISRWLSKHRQAFEL